MKLKQKPLKKINRYFPIFNLTNYSKNLNATENTEIKLCYDNKMGKFILLTVDYINNNKEMFPPRIFLNWPKYPNEITADNCPVLEEFKKDKGIIYWSKQLDL